MISFFNKIFSSITTGIISVAVSLGLITAPPPPQTETQMEPPPAQERVIEEEKPVMPKEELKQVPLPAKSTSQSPKQSEPSTQAIKESPTPAPTPPPQPPPPTIIFVPVYIPPATQPSTATTPSPTPPPASTIATKPEITLFEINKNSAALGDEITITWEAKNAVTCAISETDNISIPFTGRLPSGSLTVKLAETANLKMPTFKYFAICADKDWNTAVKTLTVVVSPIIDIKSAYACKSDLQTDYILYDLLQNGNTDGRISMRIYLPGVNEQPLGNAELVVKTDDPSQDKTLKGGASSSCGYTYGEYNFYTTQAGMFPITFSIPSLSASKTITINVK